LTASGNWQKIGLPQLAWHGPRELELTLPARWRVDYFPMAGSDRPALGSADVVRALEHPIGVAPLREVARDKREVVVLVDDLTRVTRAAQVVPHVLQELALAGVPEEGIRFVVALGCHGALDRLGMVKKLGEDVVARYPVFNHNPFAGCVEVGKTSSGLVLEVNGEVMACDLKIGIGAVTPHAMTGFGGGGKIILPGVSSLRTATDFHRREREVSGGQLGRFTGITENNPMFQDITEAARLAGLDFKIDCLVNTWGDIAALYAGEPVAAHSVAVADARRHYWTPRAREYDLAIANTYAKASEAVTGLWLAYQAVKQGGEVVLIVNAPEGQAVHYLMGPFGRRSSGELPLRVSVPPGVQRLIVFTEYPEAASRSYFAPDERVVFATRWDEVLSLLAARFGEGTRVAVYPNADIQYCA
jgi:nickel-dependent lactate racemase